jgi:hypothetical protein
MKYGDAVKTWEAVLDGKEHTFRFEHNFWSGEKKYYINDQLIEHVPAGLKQSASFGSEVPFNIGSHQGKFQHRAVGRVVFYDLYIDGDKIKGHEKHALRMPVWAFVLLIVLLLLLAWVSVQYG